MYVTIVRMPAGEAPEAIRKAWIGLSLPLAQGTPRAQSFRGVGVLTGPHTLWRQLLARLRGQVLKVRGYRIRAVEAVTILEKVDPKAAEWWRSNTPHLLTPDAYFLFDAEACELTLSPSEAQ